MWRPWRVRHIEWCAVCRQREVNDRRTDMCARCHADFQLEIENLLKENGHG